MSFWGIVGAIIVAALILMVFIKNSAVGRKVWQCFSSFVEG